tara:strand:- start:123 stop:278 length:156 start_codon:yes stop_codon:yes gene_type:complete
LIKEDSAEGDYSEFTAKAMKDASHDAAGIHSLTAEDLQNIIGDSTNVQLQH